MCRDAQFCTEEMIGASVLSGTPILIV